MNILVIGDPHFKNNNEIESNQMCDRIYQLVLEKKPDIIVNLGDSLDTHSIVHMYPLRRAIQFFHKLSQMCQHLFIIIGNHDRPNNTCFLTDDSPFLPCKQWANTTVVDKVHIYNDIVFVPYVPNGRFMEALKTVDIDEGNVNNYRLFFAHQEFKGCKMGAISSVNGDEWGHEWPLCVSGHIHEYQRPQSNILYPGTPFQLSYGMPPSKGVLFLNTDDLSKQTFIDLGLPKKLIVHLNPEQLAKYKVLDDSFVKIICKGDSKVIKEIIKLESVKELLKNPRIRLSIQEERNIKSSHVSIKTDTVAFQKRLTNAISGQDTELKELFSQIFGEF